MSRKKKSLKNLIRERMAKTGETYSTARMHVRRQAHVPKEPDPGQKVEYSEVVRGMRETRADWRHGPKADVKEWRALPEVPIERGKEQPTKAHHVVDLGSMDWPTEDALKREIVLPQQLDGEQTEGVVVLGVVMVEGETGEVTTYRLPAPLGKWAAGEIGYTRQGQGQFPAYFGFCMPKVGLYAAVQMPPPELSDNDFSGATAAFLAWQKLDELEIAKISAPTEEGSVYEVLKVGIFAIDYQVCGPILDVSMLDGRRIVLPTATVWTLAGKVTYKLPPQLGAWALHTLELASAEDNIFPAEVEFSLMDGHYMADVK